MSKNDILLPDFKSLTADNNILGSLELIAGNDVLKVMESRKFMAEWEQLYAACPWGTVFQSGDYVKSWYQNFGSKNTPILVIARSGDWLNGILPLAQGIKGLGIAGAGGWDAYYHTWLARPAHADAFIAAALALVRKNYPKQDVFFKYLPPQNPTSWLKTDPVWAVRNVSRPFNRPILNFNDPGVDKLLNKKQFRENLNKLKRRGEVQFSAVHDLTEFVALLDIMAIQHDFRKGYMFRVMPFRENPAKKKFLIDLFKKGLLDVSVLKLDDKVVSGAITTKGRHNSMHAAGINTHAPEFFRLGPSFLILNLIGLKLKAEGYDLLDLTPGDHKYKERHANEHETILEVRITSKTKAVSLNTFFMLKEYVKGRLQKHDINPHELHQRFNKYVIHTAHKASHILGHLTLNRRRVSEAKATQTIVYKYTPVNNLGRLPLPITRNNLSQILSYVPGGTGICKWEFLGNAKKGFEEGAVAYSYSENGMLQFLVWHVVNNPKQADGIQTDVAGPVLKHLYCHPKAAAKLHLFLAGVYDELCKQQNHTCMFLQGMEFSARLKKDLALKEKLFTVS